MAAREESEQLRAAARSRSPSDCSRRPRQEAERIERRRRASRPSGCCSRPPRGARADAPEGRGAGEGASRPRRATEARDITSDAHVVASDILSEGTEISRNLRELSTSLRNNAERLLRDVRLAHGGMTARLDQLTNGAEPDGGDASQTRTRRRISDGRSATGGARASGANDDLDVPEFIPRG